MSKRYLGSHKVEGLTAMTNGTDGHGWQCPACHANLESETDPGLQRCACGAIVQCSRRRVMQFRTTLVPHEKAADLKDELQWANISLTGEDIDSEPQ